MLFIEFGELQSVEDSSNHIDYSAYEKPQEAGVAQSVIDRTHHKNNAPAKSDVDNRR
nr:hypothetical protein [Butyrivibrio sp. WCD2001]